MSDIFISYSKENRDHAKKLANALSDQGWSVFWDRVIPAGRTWREFIGSALDEAKCVVVIWSEASIKSDWVIEEADSGRDRKILVPVLIDSVIPPLGFRAIQAQDLTNWDGKADAPEFIKLVDDMASILGEPSVSMATETKGEVEIEEKSKKEEQKETQPIAQKEMRDSPTQPSRKESGAESVIKELPATPSRKNKVIPALVSTGLIAILTVTGWFLFKPESETIVRQEDRSIEKVVISEPLQKVGVSKPKTVQHDDTMIDKVTGMEFVWVDGGCFQMGDTFGDGEPDEKPEHEVCLDGFYMGKYEVTQGQYQQIMGDNPSYFPKGDNYPVEQVSWGDVQTYIKKLNAKTGKTFRLPTEAEWEYAARSGGKKEKYSGSDIVDSVAWYRDNSGSQSHPVGQKDPNGLRLYDMSGNVWEWCSDRYGENYYSSSPKNNPQGPSPGSDRVNRGGGWNDFARSVRTALRDGNTPDGRYSGLGFRLVLPPGQ